MLKIEDFYALLTSDSEENALVAALRKFTEIRKAEGVVAAVSEAKLIWVEEVD